jgi:hypothetical protein
VWIRGGTTAGTETMKVRTSDGTDWSNWDNFNVTTLPNHPPVAVIGDRILAANQWVKVNTWVQYSDAEGNAAVKYEFMDGGAAANSGYFWTPGNPHHPANTSIVVSAADIDNLWIRGGAAFGFETMKVRAFDGTDWGDWANFNLTTLPPTTPPVATIDDHSLRTNEWATINTWVSYSDADGNPAVKYEFWDDGTAATSGHFWANGANQPAGASIQVTASDLNNVWVQGGQVPGTETMWVRAFDGADWSKWDSFNFTTVTNSAPVATVDDHSLPANQAANMANWVHYSDADGNTATKYQFWDDSQASTSGHFSVLGVAQPANPIEVPAYNLFYVEAHAGQVAGSERMWVRAFDGVDWSNWDSFTLLTV